MSILVITFGSSPVYWVLRQGDPVEMELASLPAMRGWSLLSPRARLGAWTQPLGVYPMGEKRCLILSNQIAFRTPTGEKEELFESACAFLRWLRFATGQASLGIDIAVSETIEVDALPCADVGFPDEGVGQVLWHRDKYAVTFELVAASLHWSGDLTVPVYAEVLHDAIHASNVNDYRKAMLYAAIGVEVMTGTRIRELYEDAVREREADLRRVRTGPANGRVEKDPIYESLQEAARNRFRVRLHELPLYVTRKSLLIEDESLYQQLDILHRTRNNLVHEGKTSDNNPTFSLDYQGMKAALDAALGAFAWFRARGRYVTMHGTVVIPRDSP